MQGIFRISEERYVVLVFHAWLINFINIHQLEENWNSVIRWRN